MGYWFLPVAVVVMVRILKIYINYDLIHLSLAWEEVETGRK